MSDAPTRPCPVTAQLQSVYDALTQAQDCIRGETPEDVTDAEAREDTISKVRDAMRTVEAMLGVAQAPGKIDAAFDEAFTELAEGHLALDRAGALKEDHGRELTIAERVVSVSAQPALKLGDIVEMNESSPYHADWCGCRMKVVSLRIDTDGKQWASVIEGDQRHRGNGVYDGETTDLDAEHLSVVSSTDSPAQTASEQSILLDLAAKFRKEHSSVFSGNNVATALAEAASALPSTTFGGAA